MYAETALERGEVRGVRWREEVRGVRIHDVECIALFSRQSPLGVSQVLSKSSKPERRSAGAHNTQHTTLQNTSGK